MNCEMELNQRGLQIPNEILEALTLADITLEAHMCRHLIMLMPQAMTALELIDVLEGMQEAFDQLLNGLIAACRPMCCHRCQTVDEGNYDLSGAGTAPGCADGQWLLQRTAGAVSGERRDHL